MFRFHARLMMVVRNIPFYQSTGSNFEEPHTWLPSLGIYPLSGWIIKALSSPLPEDIDALFSIYGKEKIKERFGNLYTLGILASLGEGFWETEAGKAIYEYLFDHYNDYLLDEKTLKKIKLQKENIFETKDHDFINEALSEESVVPLGSYYTRLPTKKEMQWFFDLPDQPLLRAAFKMMLFSEREMTKAQYTTLLSMAGYPELLSQAVELQLFENEEQREALFGIFKKNPEALTSSKLFELDILNDVRGKKWMHRPHHPDHRIMMRQFISIIKEDPQYFFLLKSATLRKVLTLLLTDKENYQELSKDYIEMVVALYKAGLLKTYQTLLEKKINRDIFLALFYSEELSEQNLMVLKKLNDFPLVIEGNEDLFFNKQARLALHAVFSISSDFTEEAYDKLIKTIRLMNKKKILSPLFSFKLRDSLFTQTLLSLDYFTLGRLMRLFPFSWSQVTQEDLVLLKKLREKGILKKIAPDILSNLFFSSEIRTELFELFEKNVSNDIIHNTISAWINKQNDEKDSSSDSSSDVETEQVSKKRKLM